MDLLIEKILYMENIYYQKYNSRNIETKMHKH